MLHGEMVSTVNGYKTIAVYATRVVGACHIKNSRTKHEKRQAMIHAQKARKVNGYKTVAAYATMTAIQ